MNAIQKLDAKLILLGDAYVGKSSISRRIVRNEFNDNSCNTISSSLYRKEYCICDQQIVVNIWDTAGQERFIQLPAIYHRGADIALVVYDVTKHISFENIENWSRQLDRSKMTVIIVGNKVDALKERQVSWEDGQMLGKKLNIPFVEVSAKEGVNIDDMMLFSLCSYYQRKST